MIELQKNLMFQVAILSLVESFNQRKARKNKLGGGYGFWSKFKF
jgi:hypothetical protein